LSSIAIAIPNLNGEKYLYETLKSLENQIVKPDEIVFSDNFSIDNSLEILKLFPSLSIKVVKPDRFLTMSENWNYVANQTNCDWFFLLSNDDLLRDTAIKRLKEVLSDLEPNIGVISFKSEIIDENSNLVLGKYNFGRPKLRKEYEFLRQNVKFLHINAASVAIRKASWIDVGRFPQEYMVLHDLVFYQRIVSKWGLLESKDVLGRYRIYRNKPNSESRTKLAINDFITYENTDLKFLVKKYPDLLEVYSSSYATDAPSVFKRDSQVISLRMVVLSVMTVCRRMQSKLSHSGFPD
jgi:glycosyltransferase involved in cell wall biosynthesis